MIRTLLVTALIPVLAVAATAQSPDTVHRAFMKELAMLEGEWEGVATYRNRQGGVDTVYQHERVEFRLGGSILCVEGTGRDASGQVAFNAYGIIYYDLDEQGYRMHAFKHDGQQTLAALTLYDDGTGFTWRFSPHGYGEIKYETSVVDGIWKESGAMTRDGGTTWFPFFAMELRRINP